MPLNPIRGLIKESLHRIGIVVVTVFIIQTTHGENEEERYMYLKNLFSLLDPYLLPIGRPPHDLENIHDCYCPRVYWPACGRDGVTYVNGCILNCLNKTKLRRFGPCIMYRRSGRIMYNVSFPEVWQNNDTSYTGSKRNGMQKFYLGKDVNEGKGGAEDLNVTKLVTYNISLPADWEDLRKVAVILSNNSEPQSTFN